MSLTAVILDFKFWCLALLVLQNSSKALLARASLKGPNEPYLYSVAVLCGESVKIVVCIIYLCAKDAAALKLLPAFLWESRKDLMLRLAVPAVVYYIQQNLEFVALNHMEAAVFQVFVQMKLITAAVFSVALLKRKLTRIQWISLFLLCVGVSIAQMQAPSCDDEPKEGLTDIVGILATMALVSLSGFAGVYTEKVLKGPATADVPFCFLQILLALVSLFLGSVLGLFQDMHLIGEYGFFHNFNLYTYLTVVVSAAGGLLVAATLKYASSIAKGYAVSVAIVTTGIASRFLFNTQLSMHFWSIPRPCDIQVHVK